MAALSALQKRAERRARNKTALDMNLVSLIDVFTILIFFLLSSATGVETLVSPKAVDLPASLADQAPRQTVLLVVTATEVLLDGRPVARVQDLLASPDDAVPGLADGLQALAARQPVQAETAARIASAGQAVTIMADKALPYRLLRKVMSTCARAGFSDVSFAVRKKLDA
ncbi:MAG: biopolymer transporter ExbD [Burkholderiales bacterium]|nr:biopolymer transporter ExbD [Burkholderiales bacterium]